MVTEAASTPKDPLPRRFGRYTLFDKIGEGGMARIYLARTRTELGGERVLVVKQILPLLSESGDFAQMLIDEAKLAASLLHGNIVQVIDLGREGDTLYIAMEYVEGFDLRELLRQCSKTKTPLPVEFSLFIVAETLRALDYAHRKKDEDGRPLGIVHRDVSPSNVLVSFEGEVKLCDFGIARAMNLEQVPQEDAIQGKAGYMSPEAAAGAALDGRADVFAVGIIAWELLAGRRLYRGEGGGPPSLEQAQAAVIPELPARQLAEEGALHAIVQRALVREPEQRYPSAQAMLRELEQYIQRAGLRASPLRLGEWMSAHFGGEILELRRMRQRAAKATEGGPLVQMSVAGMTVAPPKITVVGSPSPPPAAAAAAPGDEDRAALTPSPGASTRTPGAGRWALVALLLLVAAAVAFALR